MSTSGRADLHVRAPGRGHAGDLRRRRPLPIQTAHLVESAQDGGRFVCGVAGGGGDPAGNPTLYDAIQKAKKSSVPNDNIDRAVKRGSGAEAGGADRVR